MAAVEKPHVADLEAGGVGGVGGGGGGGLRRPSNAARIEAGSDGSVCFSDAEDRSSWHSPFNGGGGSYDNDYRHSSVCDDPEIGDPNRNSSSSDRSVEVDLESGVPEIKVHLAKVDRDCRICHLSLEKTNEESPGSSIELGCSCKADLAAAHKHCAEAWFKIKGNKTCEICGAVARNVLGVSETSFMDQCNEASDTTTTIVAPLVATRSFWHGHRFLNFLLACMVFAFVISWLFHFNVPSA